MPSLEEENISQSRDDILQKNGDIQRQEYEEGFASGEKAGFTEGEQKASVLIDRLEKIIEEMTMFKENLVKDAEKQVVDLAVAIARKEIIITMVKEALKKLQKVGTITIKINPALYDLFMKKKPELIDIHQDIIFDVNSNIPLTGPLVISQTEEVVTDIDSLMSNIIEEMRIDRGQSSEDASQTTEDRMQRTD
jgi:flagellar assembly protein FliH